jgi:hypothetical protein
MFVMVQIQTNSTICTQCSGCVSTPNKHLAPVVNQLTVIMPTASTFHTGTYVSPITPQRTVLLAKLILSSHLSVFQVVLSLRFSSSKPCIHLSSTPHVTCPVYFILFDLSTGIELSEEYKSLNSHSFLHSHCLIPIRPKHSPQQPTLEHLQPTFLPQCE